MPKPKPVFIPDTPIAEFLPLSTHVSPTVLKTTGGDFLLVWRLGGLPFVGREEWEIEHRHNTFNRLLQTLRAPDFVNVAFWVHDVRRRRRLDDRSRFEQRPRVRCPRESYERLEVFHLGQHPNRFILGVGTDRGNGRLRRVLVEKS